MQIKKFRVLVNSTCKILVEWETEDANGQAAHYLTEGQDLEAFLRQLFGVISEEVLPK